ncbi:MAG: hypothetical protein HY722_11390, partial [Planctomycetes bacterium]|nr:hypothetical protein [Planctomycetota bacterium]
MMALLRLAMLAAWVAGSWFLAHRALPWLAVRAGRVLGLALRPTPLTAKRLRRFREIRRGHAAFVLVTTAFTASLFLELSVNHKPLYIRYDDHVQLPALAEWGNFWLGWTGLAFHDRVAAKDHGLEGEQDLDARRYARWVTDPGLLEVEAAGIESEVASDEARFRRLMAEQAAARGLAYDAAEPLPEAKLADQASRQAEAARLRKLGSEIAAGRSAVLMPLYPYSPRERLLDLPGSPPHEPFQPGLPVLGTDFEGKEVVAQLLYGFRVGFAFALCV